MTEIGMEEQYLFTLKTLLLRILDSDLEPNSLETVSIQIKPKCAKPFVIIAWYRPPKHKIDDILNIEKLYKNHDKSNTEVIIMGDSNCDDLPDQDKSSIVAKLMAFYKQYQFKQLILERLLQPQTDLAHFSTTLQQISPTILLPQAPEP